MHDGKTYKTVAAALVTALLVSAVLLIPAVYADGPAVASGGDIETQEGMSVVTLTGTPREIGRQHGVLLGGRMAETEAAFKHIMPPIPGGFIGAWLVRMYIKFQLDGIEKHLTESELEEMKGMADTGPDRSRGYRDLLYYHVLQDIGQNYACTGAAVTGRCSVSKGPLAGRNFDLNKDGVLDNLKTVLYYRPEGGMAYASIAWPGMVGTVSGMNESGLCVMVFSAKSEDTSLTGVPVAFIARRVLANARSVDEAVDIVTDAKRMSPNLLLVADTRRAVVIEFDAKKVSVRESANAPLVVANHFECDGFSADAKNARNMKYSDTSVRHDRMQYLLLSRARVGKTEMLAALRDHSGDDGRRIAWGDAESINSVKDAHTVIFDPRGRTFWVSAPPQAYGEMTGFRQDAKGIKHADPLPASGYPDSPEGLCAAESYDIYLNAVELEGHGLDDEAIKMCYCSMAMDSGNYMASILAGRLLIEQYRYAEALEAFDCSVWNAPGCSSYMAMALAGRGEALRHTGRKQDARADFDAAIEMDRSDEATKLATRGLSVM